MKSSFVHGFKTARITLKSASECSFFFTSSQITEDEWNRSFPFMRDFGVSRSNLVFPALRTCSGRFSDARCNAPDMKNSSSSISRHLIVLPAEANNSFKKEQSGSSKGGCILAIHTAMNQNGDSLGIHWSELRSVLFYLLSFVSEQVQNSPEPAPDNNFLKWYSLLE